MNGSRRFVAGASIGLLLALATPVRADSPDELKESEPVPDRLVMKKATTHPIRYYLALPRGYVPNSSKKWPVFMVLAGNAENPFEETANAFFEARGDLPYLLVVPCTFNNDPGMDDVRPKVREIYPDLQLPPRNDRLAWDEAGLLAIVRDLRARYDVEPRIYLDGFSAGAILAYHFMLTHPEELAGAVTVCGNFWDVGYRESRAPHATSALTFPIRIVLGADDPLRIVQSPTPGQQFHKMLLRATAALGLGYLVYRWTRRRTAAVAVVLFALLVAGLWTFLHVQNIGNGAQAEQAASLLHELGYTDVQKTIVPGMEHHPSPQPTIEVFRPYWESMPANCSVPHLTR